MYQLLTSTIQVLQELEVAQVSRYNEKNDTFTKPIIALLCKAKVIKKYVRPTDGKSKEKEEEMTGYFSKIEKSGSAPEYTLLEGYYPAFFMPEASDREKYSQFFVQHQFGDCLVDAESGEEIDPPKRSRFMRDSRAAIKSWNDKKDTLHNGEGMVTHYFNKSMNRPTEWGPMEKNKNYRKTWGNPQAKNTQGLITTKGMH